jgi:pilus assembly protein CpaE
MTRPQELPELRRHLGLGRPAAPAIAGGPATAETEAHRDQAPAQRQAPDGPPQAGRPARAIPNVSIHAFCEAPTTVEALQAASADRRLGRAHMEVGTGGISAAVAECAEGRTPDILVVETTLSQPLMLSKLNELTDRCGSAARVLVIGQVNDVALYRQLMRRGVSEYLIAPVSPAQFIDALANLCPAPGGAQGGNLIAFVGAKGGTGSSTVCHNVAWAISEVTKSEVVVADLDLAFGTVALDFNQESMHGMAEALQAPERLDDVALDRLLTKCSQHLSILAAPVALDRDYDVSAAACGAVLDALRLYAPFAVVDLPHIWTPWVNQVLLNADEVVITATPDLANLRNARNVVDILEASRHNGKPPHLVINMAKVPKRPDLSVAEFSAALDLQPAVVIEFDPETFGLAANNGQMIEEFSRKARAARQFRNLSLTLTQRTEPKEAVKSSPLLPIFDRLRLKV